jgi:class 3 adenylate cyclase
VALKLVAIMVADIVGFSRLAGAEPRIARLRTLGSDLVDPAVSALCGLVVKRTGRRQHSLGLTWIERRRSEGGQ